MKTLISGLPGLPPAAGPYSSAVVAEGKFGFVSGILPYSHEKKAVVRGTIEEQTELVIDNVRRIVEAAGSTLEDVVNCKVYLSAFNQETFKAMNGVYERYFGTSKPSRTTLGVQLLNVDVEIDCIFRLN